MERQENFAYHFVCITKEFYQTMCFRNAGIPTIFDIHEHLYNSIRGIRTFCGVFKVFIFILPPDFAVVVHEIMVKTSQIPRISVTIE